jgi:hypothetical protein
MVSMAITGAPALGRPVGLAPGQGTDLGPVHETSRGLTLILGGRSRPSNDSFTGEEY